ncbi:MAG: hypothetical protein ACLVL7_12290 [Anaerotruncus massiliensis (ex Togo et al. 2019)]
MRPRAHFASGGASRPRPIDLHLAALEKLGVTIEEDHGYPTAR